MNTTEALEKFFADLNQAGRSVETIKWYDWHLKAFADDVGNPELNTVTPDVIRGHIQQYRDSGVSPHTAEGRDRALRAFWRWVTDEFDLPRNPMRNVRRPKKAILLPAAVDLESFEGVLATCGNDYGGIRDRAMLLLLQDTGARRQGIMNLRLSDIDLQERTVWVTEKGAPPRASFFTDDTLSALAVWLEIRRAKTGVDALFTSLTTFKGMNPDAVNKMIERRKREAGVTGRTNPHSLRHGIGIDFGKAGQLAAGAKVLGNGIWITGEYYQRYDIDSLKELYDKVKSD